MKRIKITEEQATFISSLTEDELESPLGGNEFLKPSNAIKRNFKKEGGDLDVKFESKINEGLTLELVELAQATINFIRDIITDPSQAGIDSYWVSLGMTRGEVFELLADTGLMSVAGLGTYAGIKKSDLIKKSKAFFKGILGKKKDMEGAKNTFKDDITELEGNLPPNVSDEHPEFNPPEMVRTSSVNSSMFNVVWNDSDLAIVDLRGNLYAIYAYDELDGISDYSEREVMSHEPDDEGEMNPNYSEDFEVDGEALENYLSDNSEHIEIGVGIEDWNEDANRLTKIDDAVKEDIVSTWQDPELRNILYNIEETDAGSSGAYVGGMNGGIENVIDREYSPANQLGEDEILDETTDSAQVGGDSGTFAYDAPAGDGDDFWTAGNKQNKKMTKEQLEEHFMNGFGESNGGDYRSGFEMDNKQQLEYNYHKELKQMQNATSPEEQQMLAKRVGERAKALGVELPKGIFGLNEDAKTDTQWPEGAFVEPPPCSKLDNNKEAQNGGCNQGEMPKMRTSKNSVISNQKLHKEIAEKTGKSITEVKAIIDNYNNK